MATLLTDGWRGRGARFAAVTVCALVVAGCGGDSDGDSEEQQGKASTPANVSTAQQRAAEAMKPPEYTGPTESWDMAKNRGKSVWFISPSQAIIYSAAVAAGAKEAAEVAGIKLTIFDGKGMVSEFNKGVLEAIANRADGIILQAIDPALVEGPLAKARAASIPVIDSDVGDNDQPLTHGLFAHATVCLSCVGRSWADYIVSKSNGKPVHIMFVDDPSFKSEQFTETGLREELGELCPECTIDYQKFQVPAMAQQIPTSVINGLRRNPDTQWIVGGFGATVKFILQGMRASNAIGKVRLITASGELQNLDLVREDEVLEADVGEGDPAWLGWSQIDQIGRAMAGVEPVDQKVPIRLFTRDNVPPTNENLYGDTDFRSEYKRVWGVS